MNSDVVIIVPVRLASTRLARKALQYIGSKMMIQHVVGNIVKNLQYPLYIATDSSEIRDAVEGYGVSVIMTNQDCNSGSDRVYEAFCKINKELHGVKYIINMQGDMPFIVSKIIDDVVVTLKQGGADIATAASIVDATIASKESNVKLVVDCNRNAMYFSRSMIPCGGKEFLYHIGIYGFTVGALEKFVNSPCSYYEQYEKLEQLRMLENGQKIAVCISDTIPISVDTEEDLEIARDYYEKNKLQY